VARVGGAGRGESLEPPFVGRDEEFRLVLEQLHAAERQRKLRMISVTGQAGMGKSRLAWELEKHLDGLADTLYYWHQGRSPAYGEGVTFWALGEMVRRRCGIAETDDDATTRDKLRDTLANFVPDAEERRWIEPALGALLGVEQADWGAREQLFSAWRTFFERVADSGPVVLVFEDLQWADDGLLDFIEHTLEWTRDRPMLIVTLARPEMLDRRPNFGLGQRAFVGIHLEPLADEPMVALLRGLVPALAEGDLRRIIERAEGVPLYAVETVRALVDGGHLVRRGDAYELVGEMPGLDVPPTLRALIGSRLDALDTADRALLQDASVVGVVFSVPAVAALSGRSAADVEGRLRALTQRELVALETDARSPERGQYRFLQGLIREVAYGMLSKRDRRTRHLAAAQFFETLGDAELAAILASHYGEAYRAAPDGPAGAAVAAQARVALRAAAERATRLHSHQQAMALTEQALAVTFDEAEQNSLRLAAADSAVNAGVSDKAETYLREAIAWLIKQKNLPAAAMARAQLGGLLLSLSRVDEAVELLASAERELPADAPEAFVNVTGQLARGHMFRGEPDEALGAVDRALEVAERGAMSVASTLQLLITRSWALKLLGRPTEAAALLHGTAELADADGDLSARVRARMNLSSYLVVEDPRAGRRVAEEGVALAEQYGLAGWLDPLAANAAAMSLLIGDLDRVMSLHSAYRDSSGAGTLSVLGAFTAAAAALRGDSTLASQEVATQAAAIAASTSAQDQSAWQLVLLFMALGEGRLADARQHAQRSRDLYAGTDSSVAVVMGTHAAVLMGDADAVGRDLEAWSVLDRGGWIDRARETIQAALLAMEGKVDEAARTYRRVIEEWRAADLRLDLALALLERARLLGSHDAEAAAGRSEARAILEQMGALQLADRLDPPVDGSAAVTAAPRQPKAQPTATPAGGGG
jgi:tetratricopeptide (TPR) repeat protein